MGNPSALPNAIAGDSSWIDRDKLLTIELQEARALRAEGKQVPSDQQIIDRYQQLSGKPPSHHAEESRSRSFSEARRRATQASEAEEDESSSPLEIFDPRSPEEIALDSEEAAHDGDDWAAMTSRLRSSSSRIPLATTSAVPVPQQHLDRNTPLQRKRGQSINWDDYESPNHTMRPRPESRGSQNILDDGFGSPNTPPSQSSPPKSRQTSNARSQKAPVTPKSTTNAKLRGASATRTSSSQRPGTSSGLAKGTPRPSTPEGEPPWLAHSYKPDPRLPPDQQILPTHAKKMLQEQWEKEGKPGGIFDRNFSPLSLNQQEKPNLPAGPAATDRVEGSSWPLTQFPPDPPVSPLSDHASYSTLPRVHSPPIISTLPSPRLQQQQKDFHLSTEEPKGKGCACCVVM